MRQDSYPTELRLWAGRQILDVSQFSIFIGSAPNVEQKLRAYFTRLNEFDRDEDGAPNVHLEIDGPLARWGGHIWAALDISVTLAHPHAERFNKYIREQWLPRYGKAVSAPFKIHIPGRDLTVTLPQVLLWGAYWQYGYTSDCPMMQALDQHCSGWRKQLGDLWAQDGTDPSYHLVQEWLSGAGLEAVQKHVSSRLYFNLLFIDRMTPTRAVELMEWNMRMDEQPPIPLLLNRVLNSGIDLSMRLPNTAQIKLQDVMLTVGHFLDAYYERGNQNAKHWLKAFIAKQMAPDIHAAAAPARLPSI